MGMVFADTRIAGRMKVKMESLRDAFVAIFFLTFGMLIDPAALGSVLPMLAIAVPLILLNDLFLTASLAYFIGFSGRASTAIGTSLVARNEEAILYATVGARAIRANPQLSNDYAGTYLTPFAGILCIVMSSLAPILMGRSNRIAAFFANRLPKSLRFGAELVKRTLKTVIMPNFLPIYRRKRLFQASLIFYAAWIIDLTVTTGAAHLAMALLTPVLVFGVWASRDASPASDSSVTCRPPGAGGPRAECAVDQTTGYVTSLIHVSSPIVVSGPWPGYTRVSAGSPFNRRRVKTIFAGLPPWTSVRPQDPAYRVSPVKSAPAVSTRKHALPSVCPGVWRAVMTRSPSFRSEPSFRRTSAFMEAGGAGRNHRVPRAFLSSRGASTSKIAIFAPVAVRIDASSAVESGCPCVFRM